MLESDLARRFPDMRPIRSAPSVTSFAGCGLSVHGARGHDPETDTFVTTHWVCIAFIPVLALAAYRVARAASGWQFVGRVPLSPLARAWNGVVCLALLGVGGTWAWMEHARSPSFIAAQKVVDADQLAEAGQVVPAAELYREVALSGSPEAPTARERLVLLVEQLPGSATLEETAQVVGYAVEIERQQQRSRASPLPAWGFDLAIQHGRRDPHAVLAIVDILAPLAPNALVLPRQRVLEIIVAREPDNMEALGQLAGCYQARGQWPRCEALLAPHRACLGNTEGARVLGQVYARQGKLESALALLQPYVDGRLERLCAAEKALAEAIGQQPAQNPAEAAARIRTDPAVRSAQAALARELGVIPAALELGQVYYWLGKHHEGRSLFEQLLECRKRDFGMLLQVSLLLREVGAVAEARALAEEAFEKENDPTRKSMAAVQRAVVARDLEEKIAWLRKANPDDLEVKAMLSAALGSQALVDGNDDQAAQHLRNAIDLYAQQGAGSSSLNNAAIAYEALYQATGDPKALTTAAGMLDQALARQPHDSILLSNMAELTLEAALRDLIGPAIDLSALKQRATWQLLGHLYRDPAERDRLIERVRQHVGMARARLAYERLLLLAPRNATAYNALLNLYLFTRDTAALRALARQLEAVEIDLTDTTREQLDYFAGKDDARLRKEKAGSVQRQERLVQQAREGGPGVTLAVALSLLNGAQLEREALGPTIKGDDLVARAEEALRAAPSVATQEGLRTALLARACQTLAEEQPGFRQLQKRVGRALDSGYLVAVILSQPGELREAVRKNPDVQRSLGLTKDLSARFPDEPEEWSWAMLQASDPDPAATLAKALLTDPFRPLQRTIEAKLNPLSAAVAYREAWALRLAGGDEPAAAVLQRCAARGVPLLLDPGKP